MSLAHRFSSMSLAASIAGCGPAVATPEAGSTGEASETSATSTDAPPPVTSSRLEKVLAPLKVMVPVPVFTTAELPDMTPEKVVELLSPPMVTVVKVAPESWTLPAPERLARNSVPERAARLRFAPLATRTAAPVVAVVPIWELPPVWKVPDWISSNPTVCTPVPLEPKATVPSPSITRSNPFPLVMPWFNVRVVPEEAPIELSDCRVTLLATELLPDSFQSAARPVAPSPFKRSW